VGFFSCDRALCSGPITVRGRPVASCELLSGPSPNVSGLALAGAFTSLSGPFFAPASNCNYGPCSCPLNDIVVTSSLVAVRAPAPSCVGGCGGEGQVTIDELLTMVNIALGNAHMSQCEAGDDNDDNQIPVDEILRAVNVALNGCT
jgi:hypothetical protein